MAQCPRCREDMPLLSKICPVCGYVEEGSEAGASPTEFAHKMEDILLKVKNLPTPSFFKSMGQLTFVMFPVIAVYMLIIALISEAGLFWLLFLLFAVLSVLAIVKKTKGKLGNDQVNREFQELKNSAEYNKRIAMHSFGKSAEVANIINEISTEINHVEKARKSASVRNLLVWVIILLLIFSVAGAGVIKMEESLSAKADSEIVEKAVYINGVEVANWQKAVEMVKGMPDDDAGVEQARVDVVKAMLEAGETQAAENFFVDHSMGKIRDYDVAAAVVEYYVAQGDKDAAEKFLERCTKMRYNSDKTKLRKLIN